MDALDILGGLLGAGRTQSGGQSSGGGGGLGGRILEELLKSGTGRASAPAPAPSRTSSRGGSTSSRNIDVASEVNRLEDLLGVATGGRSGGQSGASVQSRTANQGGAAANQVGSGGQSRAGQRTAPAPAPYGQSSTPSESPFSTQQSAPPPEPGRYQAPPSQSSPSPIPSPSTTGRQATTQDEAIVLVQAMINAAKSDGKLDNQEQQAILSRVPNDEATISFLRQEFARPLDVREFAWNVPLGLEVQVYTISLATIQVDTREEVQYLRELAHGLRLGPDLCNQLHARFGVQIAF